MLFFIELIVRLFTPKRNFKRLELLNENRSVNDLDDFFSYFEDQGISKKIIEITINTLRIITHHKEFIPLPSDSFLKDYNWKYFYSDEYSTKQMRLAAYIMDEVNERDLKESHWREYEKEYGEIDNFQHLFHFLSLYNNIMAIVEE